MSSTYSFNQRLEVDGAEVIPRLANSSYATSLSSPADKVTITAGATDVNYDLSSQGTIKRLIVRCLSDTPTQATMKVNGSSLAMKINPIVIICGTITSVTFSNADADNAKVLEVTPISE